MLRKREIVCFGWDPNHRPGAQLVASDIVNLGYVVNVIERPRERVEALKNAWNLAQRVLIVSAQLEHDMKGQRLRPLGDGYVTGANTFQKYFTQSELRDWVEAVLGLPSIAAAPGVLYVFRDEKEREAFAASRYRRARALTSSQTTERLFEEHREVLQPLIDFLNDRGRLPEEAELESTDELKSIFGSIRRAGHVLLRSIGVDGWEGVRKARQQDLLLYIALSRFSRRPRFSSLPESLQRDIRSFFQNYSNALNRADWALASIGDPAVIDNACRKSPVGKLMPTALYVHRSALPALPLELRLYEGCAASYLGDMHDANIIKLRRDEAKISYLTYPDFDRHPHPCLESSTSVSLQTFRIKKRDFTQFQNPPILHRKEQFVSADYPGQQKFLRLSEQEERFGLYAKTHQIGTMKGWEELLTRNGLVLRGHRVVRQLNSVAETSA